MTQTSLMWVTFGLGLTALAAGADGHMFVAAAAAAGAAYAGYKWYAAKQVGSAVKSALDLGLDDEDTTS